MREARRPNMGGESNLNPLQALKNENSALAERVADLEKQLEDSGVNSSSSLSKMKEVLLKKDEEIAKLDKSNKSLKVLVVREKKLLKKIKILEKNLEDSVTLEKVKDQSIADKENEIQSLKEALQKNGSKGKVDKDKAILEILTKNDLTSDAKKVLKAIFERGDGAVESWVQISSRVMKNEYKVHTSKYTPARLELKEKGLIDYEEANESESSNRKICRYKLKEDFFEK